MRKMIRKTLALLLTAALTASFWCLAAYAVNRTPIVCVTGETEIYVWKEDGSSYAPKGEAADALVNEAIRELIPVFLKALATNRIDDWAQQALDKLTPMYDEIRPNPDGSLPENTGINFSWSPETIPAPESVNYYYQYEWDYRLSPLDAADDLQAYIKAIEAKTGSDKVVLISRCGSTSISAAYLYKYGTDDLTKMIFVSSSLLGIPYVDAILSGQFIPPADAVYHFVAHKEPLAEFSERLNDFCTAFLYAINENGGGEDASKLVSRAFNIVSDPFVGPFLRSFYGISPGFVATMGDNYDGYRDFIFPTDELKQEYAAVLAKTDEYHYNVQEKLGELFTAARDAGVPVCMISVYGDPTENPNGERSHLVGDSLTDAGYQSLGATVPVYPNTLSDEYIAERTAAGFGKYISPDRQIDASTCLFPETAWFIRNMRHWFWERDLYELVTTIAWTDGMTVDTDPAFPQFLNAREDHSAFDPALPVNENDIDPDSYQPDMNTAMGFFCRVLAFYVKLTARFFNFFARLKAPV